MPIDLYGGYEQSRVRPIPDPRDSAIHKWCERIS